MRKFKRFAALGLAAAMAATSLAACGTKDSSSAAGGDTKTEAAKEDKTEAAKEEDTKAADAETEAASSGSLRDEIAAKTYDGEGKTLNIYVWNDEFISRVADHFPGYQKVDATTGKIGNVDVVFTKVDNQDNKYQDNLDEVLQNNGEGQENASADDKIDIFLVEADYANKYIDTNYTMNVKDLGITDDDLSKQYQYTKDAVTDSNGNLKGVSWQGCPGVLIYRRDIAKEVLGTDDPDEVQKSVADWNKFLDTAKKMAEKGYTMTSSANDAYRVFSNNVSSKWVEDGKLNIDPNIQKWVEVSKEMVDGKMTGTHDLWSDDWSKGFFKEGKVFCYFGPAWLIDFSMHSDEDGSVGKDGGWAAAKGPQGFFWGGTWMCAANGTDNPELVKDLMLCLTTDDDTMQSIVEKDNDFVNNSVVMEKMAADTSYGDKILGGQNAIPMFCEGIKTVSLANISAYDQGCNEEFQKAMKAYFEGNSTYDEALKAFKDTVHTKYPAVSVD